MRIMEAYSVLLPLDSFICFSKDFICAMLSFHFIFHEVSRFSSELHLPVLNEQ